MNNYTNDIELLMQDCEGDFLDPDHIRRFYSVLLTEFSELLENPKNLETHIVDLYYLYLISSFITDDLIKNKTVHQLSDILKNQKDEVCIDENDTLMVEVAHILLNDLPFDLKTDDLIDDDFSKILINVYSLDSDVSSAISKMQQLLNVVKKSMEKGLFNFNDYSIDYFNGFSL